MAFTAGTRLGPYEILSVIGAGGMGEVWKARDARLGRIVAIKRVMAPHSDRFDQEARAIAALNHPHICQIHDIGSDYLVLEFIDGEPLRGPLPVEEVIRLAIQIAGALDAAHRQGILHRDLKPANILVTKASGRSADPPVAKLLDFGLAKLVTDDADMTKTVDGTVVGTAAYMSPEQAEGKPLDARSDIFSFGAVIYEMLSGTRAFAGESVAQVLCAVLRDDPRPLQAPQALERLVSRCLAKSPSARFPTMADVKTALEQISLKPTDRKPSIAVLPFTDMSAAKDHEWFSDGLAEEIINALAHVPGLTVIARTSAFAFKGKSEDIRRIAEVLGVANILEGSVRKAGSHIRVTAQLITAADGSHLWSERYDRELADVFAVQDEIATAIAGALKVKLSAASTPLRRHTPNLLAYEHYLKAIYHAQRWTPESMTRAEDHCRHAIELDPAFALAHAELGHLFARMAIYGLMPAHEAMPRLRTEARQALDIDPSLPEAHAMLGMVAAMYDYDWQEAERQFRLALAHDAAPALVHRYYAHYCLLPVGRAGEAVDQHAIGLSEDPLNLAARAEQSVALRAAGRKIDGDNELRHVVELDETFWFPYFMLAVNHALDGKFEDALSRAEQGYRAAPWFTPVAGVLAALLERSGDTSRAEALRRTLWPEKGDGDPIAPAIYHLVRGDLEQVADWTEKAIELRQPAVLFFVNGHATALRTTSRWPALARLMNLRETI